MVKVNAEVEEEEKEGMERWKYVATMEAGYVATVARHPLPHQGHFYRAR